MQCLLFVLEYSKIWRERLVSIQGKWFYTLNPLEMKARTKGLEMQQKDTTSSKRLKKELKYNKPGRTDVEAETPILWPPDGKSWLTGKDLDAGKDWGQEKKGTTEDEMVGWYHGLNGHEFEQTPGDGEGQGSLVCCSPWGHKESDTTYQLSKNLRWSIISCNVITLYSLEQIPKVLLFEKPVISNWNCITHTWKKSPNKCLGGCNTSHASAGA